MTVPNLKKHIKVLFYMHLNVWLKLSLFGERKPDSGEIIIDHIEQKRVISKKGSF